MKIKVGVSKKHVHLTEKTFHKLFSEANLEVRNYLKQPGEYASTSTVDLKLNDNEYLECDLLDFNIIINNNIIGKLSSFENHNNNKIIIVKNKEKEILLPYNNNLIENINLDKKEITYKNIEGLI